MADDAIYPRVSLALRPISAKWLVKAVERRADAPRCEGWLCHAVSPNEWLLVAGWDDCAAEVTPGYDPSSGRLTVDVSATWHCLRITGDATCALLAKGAGVDLHPSAFARGDWRSCRFGHYRVHLHLIDDAVADLYLERSVTHLCTEYLRELGAEFGLVVESESNRQS